MNATALIGVVLLGITAAFGYAAFKSFRVQNRVGVVLTLISVALCLLSLVGALLVFVNGHAAVA